MAYTIWTSEIDLDNWDLESICEDNNYDADALGDIMEYVYELNNDYLMDERLNLNIDIPEGLVVYGNANRWNGSHHGIVSVEESNIGDCLKSWGDYNDINIIVDDNNDLVIIGKHHDGTDYYTVRRWNSAKTRDHIISMLDEGEIYSDETYQYTDSIGDIIKKVYGWH